MDSAGIRALVRVMELGSGTSLIVQPSPQVFTLLHLLAFTDGVLPKVEILEPPFLEREGYVFSNSACGPSPM